MRLSRFLLLPVAMLALAACSQNDGVSVNARPPLGGVRFINAVPDGGAVDIRYIDQVEWSGSSVNGTNYGLAFRAGTNHWATEAKARHIRVFPSDSAIAVTSTILLDTTITITANKNVTLMLVGSRAAGGKVSFLMIDDTPPALTGPQIAVRVVNAASSSDIPATAAAYIVATTTTALPGTPTFASIPSRTASAYVVRDTIAGAFAIRTTAAGDVSTIWSAGAPAGASQVGLVGAAAGYLGAGSALSAYVFPRSVAGTAAPASFTTPGLVFFVDQIPTPP